MEKNTNNGLELSTKLLQYEDTKKRRASQNTQKPSLWFSKRLLVSIILFLCFMNFQVIRNNLNIAVVEMTTTKSHVQGNTTIFEPPDFEWDRATIGLTLSIISYGGLFSFFGEFLIDWFGGSVTSSICMFIAGILTIVHPAILYLDFRLFLVCRFLTGLFEMFFYMSTTEIYSRWIPKPERSMLISLSFNGTNVGSALTYPICGYLAHEWGWQIVFYATGIATVLVSLVCFVVVRNKPSQDNFISKKERFYILQQTDHETRLKEEKHPYKDILTSAPVWALCIDMFTFIWVTSILGACLPLYIKDMTGKETHEIGVISSIPNVVYIFMFPICGFLMNYWKDRSNISWTTMYKIMINIAFTIACVLFVATALISHFETSMFFFTLIQIAMSFVPLILQIIAVSLAPDHSSVIAGLTTFFFSASSIGSQTLTGFMIIDHTLQEWNNCFYLTAGISALGAVTFLVFGSSEPQPWSAMAIIEEECTLDDIEEKV